MSSYRETPSDNRRDLILYRRVKALLREDAELSEIEQAIAEHCRDAGDELAAVRADLRRVATLFRGHSAADQRRIYPQLLAGAGPYASEKLAVRSRRLGLELHEIPSFTVCMNNRMYQKRTSSGSVLPELLLASSKAEGHRFAQQHGVRTPRRLAGPLPAHELPLQPGSVVKPSNAEGSRGVYLLISETSIREVKTGAPHAGFSAVREAMTDAVQQGAVGRDEWVLEELITEDSAGEVVGRDLKFYCFYGSCPLVLEVVRWPEVGYCWWTAEGEQTETGKYPELSFRGEGFPPELRQEAARLSAKIPAPFVRIDFINSSSEPALGEFESHPGDYERFDSSWDRLLGREYLDAERRLVQDLLAGKSFPYFSRPA